MTDQEELARLYEDRDMLEIDIDMMNEEMRQMEFNGTDEEDEYYSGLQSEVNAMENEVMYLTACIESLEAGHGS